MQRWLKQQSGLTPNDLVALQEQRTGKQANLPSPPTATNKKINRFLSQGTSLQNSKPGLRGFYSEMPKLLLNLDLHLGVSEVRV